MFTRMGIASLALVAALTLTGCGDDEGAPEVDGTAPGSAAGEPTPTAGDDGTGGVDGDGESEGGTAGETPCALGALPSSALIRLCTIAVAPGGTRAQVILTVDEPTPVAAAGPTDRAALEAGCANSIRDAGWNTPGTARIADDATFITATLDVQGVDWPAPSVLYVGFGQMFAWASAPNVTSPNDSISFGCFEPLRFHGSGTAQLVGLIDAADYNGGIDHWVEFTSFGVGEAYGSDTGVTFENCTFQLSAHAESLNDRWLSPAEWGSGCVTGFVTSEHD